MMITNDSKNKRIGLYIHIPFCAKRCNYCDFLSYSNGNNEDHKAYVDALVTELKYQCGKDYIFDTIYMGGGSPSFLNVELIQRILGEIHGSLKLTANPEITIEVNPGQLTKEKLQTYAEGGINRLSMGVQSFDNNLLNLMGRMHKGSDSIESFYLARESGFSNISLDLIFALPGQTLNLWIDSLNQALDMDPEHISFYALQIEEGTPFYQMVNDGRIRAVSDSEDRKMYHKAIDMLYERGYVHYEISNGAKPGFQSRHNMKYWSMEDYIGVGLGSHSYMNGKRFSNETDLRSYIRLSGDNEKKEINQWPGPWSVICHKNTKEDEMAEYMFTGLRKVEGINIGDYTARFGVSPLQAYEKPIEHQCKAGLLMLDEQRNSLRLTAKGMDLFNRVLVDFV